MKKNYSVTAGAYTKARKKLKHTAFIELNDGIIDIYYKNDDIKRLKGFRILAFDGSKITLPKNKAIKKEFGSISISNSTENDLGEYSRATFLACYDVLNNIAVKSILGHGCSYEVDLTEQMLPSLDSKDLLVFDRGYASYSFMASLIKQQKSFIIRCPKSFLKATRTMFDTNSPESMTVLIDVPIRQKKKVAEFNLPKQIKIRLVKVILPSGEIEVLATSLFDSKKFTTEDFKHMYGLRWGIETFFSKLKGRLGLENFTGKTIESIYQDFWSTIFISNIETIMTEDIEEEMNENKPDNYGQLKINRAVSFNVIKKLAFEIFFNEHDRKIIFDKIMELFTTNPVPVRENRRVPRKKISDTRSHNFQKRVRKHVF